MNTAGHAINFCRSGSSSKKIIQSKDWTFFLFFFGGDTSNKNTVSSILSLKFEYMVLNLEVPVGPSGRRPMLRPEQDSVDTIGHVIEKFAHL